MNNVDFVVIGSSGGGGTIGWLLAMAGFSVVMLELGSDSEKYHFHLGAELARFPVEQVFLLGEETRPVVEGALSAGAPAGKFVFSNQ